MANIQQIKLNDSNFVTEFYVLQELLPDFIEVVVTADMGGVMGRKYDRETNTFLNEWLEGYEPKPEVMSEELELMHTTNANVEYLVCLQELNMI
jgi:hypothetical protein